MAIRRKPPFEYSVKDLERELIARGAQVPSKKMFNFKDKEGTPERDVVVKGLTEFYKQAKSLTPDENLRHISNWDLVKILIYKTRQTTPSGVRGVWHEDTPLDFYKITDEMVKRNSGSTAAVCMKGSLTGGGGGTSLLKVKNFGKTFNLSEIEPFREQPVVAGKMCTGFLVEEDVIATAAHFANENNVQSLSFIFGYQMTDTYTSMTQISNSDIYEGTKIIGRVYDPQDTRSDWALVRLNRKVYGRPVLELSSAPTCIDQPLYTLGHPWGLPLKYAPGARIGEIFDACFSADLNVYSGNAGSPVCDSDTHEVVGMVVRGNTRDFRWTERGWMSIDYPSSEKNAGLSECTRVSEFIDIVNKL